MPANLIADIFSLAEQHDVTISLSYDKAARYYKITVRKKDLEVHRYFWPGNGNSGNETFVFGLMTFMISEIETREKERKQ